MYPQQQASTNRQAHNVIAVDQSWSGSKPSLDPLLKSGIERSHPDVTFIVGEERKRFSCHLQVLAARSTVFKAMLSEPSNQDKSQEVTLEGLDPLTFKKFLEFVYTDTFGANNVLEALELLQVAHSYDFPLLVTRCVNLLEKEIALEHITAVLQAARENDHKKLMEKAAALLAKSLYEMRQTEIISMFLKLDKLTLIEILKRNDLKIKEVELFGFVRKWAEQQPGKTEQQELQDILPHIRFPTMTASEIWASVVPTSLLSECTLSALYNYVEADIETKKQLARTLSFECKRRQPPDLIVSVSMYSGDLMNINEDIKQFQELKECVQFSTLIDYLQNPLPEGRVLFDGDHACQTAVGLNSISVYCPANTAFRAAPGGAVLASFKKLKITVTSKDHCDKCDASCDGHYKALLTLYNVEAEEGKITDIQFGTVIRVEQRKFYGITVEEVSTPTNMKEYRRHQIYDAKDFGSIRKWIFADVGNQRLTIQDIQRNPLRSRSQISYEEPQLICKLGLEGLL